MGHHYGIQNTEFIQTLLKRILINFDFLFHHWILPRYLRKLFLYALWVLLHHEMVALLPTESQWQKSYSVPLNGQGKAHTWHGSNMPVPGPSRCHGYGAHLAVIIMSTGDVVIFGTSHFHQYEGSISKCSTTCLHPVLPRWQLRAWTPE